MNVDSVKHVVVIEEFWLTFIISTLLPMVVALVTKRFANPNVKALTLAALSIVTGIFTVAAANGGQIELKDSIVGFFVSFVTAVGLHFGLLAPTGITGAHGAIARKFSSGIGSDTHHNTPSTI